MERDFYTDEFEDLIKTKADQYRMYPSDKVWKGIKRSLHSSKRKYWFGFALLLTGLSYFGIDQLIISPPSKQITIPTGDASFGSISPERPLAKVIPFDQITPGTLSKNQPDVRAQESSSLASEQASTTRSAITVQIPGPRVDGFSRPIEGPLVSSLTSDAERTEESTKSLPIVGVDKSMEERNGILIPSFPVGITTRDNSQQQDDNQKINWLQEYAVYDLAPTKPQRINWQLSFAPTMNYRRLIGRNNANIQSSSRNIPIALSIEGDLDKLVNHKPALGFELGSYVVYSLSHNLALKAGLQFNYSRYEIQAYSSATERATIALNSINGLASSSISNLTQLRNFGGYAVQDLQNQYFQLSVPLGIEINLLGSNKLQLGVAGTVQPTYLLNRNNYLISSDYKNYTKEPSLMRRWNVNASAETFVSYKTAGLKWQVGPQIRYQLFSTFTDKYPIKEYLIEYGVKIGVTKTIR